jgi:hypothetical protein
MPRSNCYQALRAFLNNNNYSPIFPTLSDGKSISLHGNSHAEAENDNTGVYIPTTTAGGSKPHMDLDI